MKKRGCFSFIAGFGCGCATLFVLVLLFGDYEDAPSHAGPPVQSPTSVTQAYVAQIVATPAEPLAGLSFEEVCNVSRRNLTQPQITLSGRI